jgi:2-amino-4-hydroxy-6-hydroxymethyldihydropteridine diphosphokinase
MDGVEKVVLLLGSNIEPRKKFLDKALFLLQQELGKKMDCSAIYESEPWGFDAKVSFLNRVVVFETRKNPEEVLEVCLDVEMNLGRERKEYEGYASRTVDVDVLYFGNRVISSDRLVIPHPRLHLRRFTLLPMVEVQPELVHPVLMKTQKELLEICPDDSEVKLFID